MTIAAQNELDFLYPDSDGKLMADNTEQFSWIVLIKENLEILFAESPDVFVAGDLLWYPVKVDAPPVPAQAPDAMVVFGRPKGRRGSYRQWQEANIPPQVVFEILSPSNGAREMRRKFKFYEAYGVEEYYVYDPDQDQLEGWSRQDNQLIPIDQMHNWVSPRLQIRFDTSQNELRIYRPDGQRFLSPVELEQRANWEERRANREEQRANQAEQRANQAEQQFEDLLAKLRERGIDPNRL
jgi:Uma2 family endonuclease